MKHYIQPAIEKKPDAIILHIGTNDLRNSKKNEVIIAEEIVGLAKAVELEEISVTISGIIARDNKYEDRR